MMRKTIELIKSRYKTYIYTKKSIEELDAIAVKAIISGDIKEMSYLYPSFLNPNVNFCTPFYKELNPLFLAAQNGQIKILDYILSLNIDINKVDTNGRNALMFAILSISAKDENATCYFLIDKGIDLSHKDLDQKPAICYLFRSKNPLALVRHMFSKGYDAALKQIDKESNFFNFMFSMHSSAVKKTHDKRLSSTKEICSYLIDNYMTGQDCLIEYRKIKSKRHTSSEEIKDQLLAKIEKEWAKAQIPLAAPNGPPKAKFINKI